MECPDIALKMDHSTLTPGETQIDGLFVSDLASVTTFLGLSDLGLLEL